MSKFGNIAATKVKADKVAEYELFDIVGMTGAKIFGRPATRRLNTAYTNAVLLKTEKLNRKARVSQNKAAIINAQSDATREPFGRFVLVDWKGIKDENGKEVPFSTADAIDFIAALPDFIYDELLVFFSNEVNFTDIVSVDEAGEIAKN